jgi:Flp pilus assembly protein TadG
MSARQTYSPRTSTRGAAGLLRLAVDEDGAAYTLSYVMVIPLYALLICLMIETVLMLTAKLGTVYAAYAAARSASVWSSAAPWETAQEKARLAAVKCMTPFASGTQSALQSLPVPDAAPDAAFYWGAYQAFAKDPVAGKYLLAKYGYASRHTKVTIQGPPATWDAEITAEVTYEFPFNVPGIGRILGRRGVDGGYYFSLTSQATIPNEGPQNDRNTIGIGYGKLE